MSIEDRFKIKKKVDEVVTEPLEALPTKEEQVEIEKAKAKSKRMEELRLEEVKKAKLKRFQESQLKLLNYIGVLSKQYMWHEDDPRPPTVAVHIRDERTTKNDISVGFVVEFYGITTEEMNKIVELGNE